ncbi:toll/interleukin-1 receptor domain-containing protein [Sphingopyxis sp. J-6]|uniref:toll/interleukin-1 receptor domain-containing protein n=1 Tax=Sphingopyxis sp. J-6 TaxID=3122054 RepID=UPI00398423FE
MPAQVFISYSSKDRTVANMVCALLEERGHRCWIAPRDILPGASWGEAIIDGLKESAVFVLVFSQNANASPQILREVERAVHLGLPIIPFRIEDVLPERSLEYFMSVPHWLDALSPPVEDHIVRLGDVVGQLVNGAAGRGDYIPRKPRGAKSVSWNNALVRAGAGGAVLALLLLAAWLGGLAPPESPVGWLAALLAVAIPVGTIAAGGAKLWTRGWVRGVLLALLLAAAAGYGWTRSAYVIAGENAAPLVRGTECTPDAKLVFEAECPDLPSDALADAAYDPAMLWTAASIGRVKLMLAAAWALAAAAAALLVAGWMGGPRRLKQEG